MNALAGLDPCEVSRQLQLIQEAVERCDVARDTPLLPVLLRAVAELCAAAPAGVDGVRAAAPPLESSDASQGRSFGSPLADGLPLGSPPPPPSPARTEPSQPAQPRGSSALLARSAAPAAAAAEGDASSHNAAQPPPARARARMFDEMPIPPCEMDRLEEVRARAAASRVRPPSATPTCPRSALSTPPQLSHQLDFEQPVAFFTGEECDPLGLGLPTDPRQLAAAGIRAGTGGRAPGGARRALQCLQLPVFFAPFTNSLEESVHFPLVPGTLIAGRYRIVGPLGSGVFSHAVQCEDEEGSGRQVCIKVRAAGVCSWG